jgi:hypothetical protein
MFLRAGVFVKASRQDLSGRKELEAQNLLPIHHIYTKICRARKLAAAGLSMPFQGLVK